MTLLTLCMCHLIVMETLSFSTKIGSLTCVVPLKGMTLETKFSKTGTKVNAV